MIWLKCLFSSSLNLSIQCLSSSSNCSHWCSLASPTAQHDQDRSLKDRSVLAPLRDMRALAGWAVELAAWHPGSESVTRGGGWTCRRAAYHWPVENTGAHTHSQTRAHTHTLSLTCRHIHTLSHTCTHTHSLSLSLCLTHTHTHTHTHSLSLSLTYTHTHTRTAFRWLRYSDGNIRRGWIWVEEAKGERGKEKEREGEREGRRKSFALLEDCVHFHSLTPSFTQLSLFHTHTHTRSHTLAHTPKDTYFLFTSYAFTLLSLSFSLRSLSLYLFLSLSLSQVIRDTLTLSSLPSFRYISFFLFNPLPALPLFYFPPLFLFSSRFGEVWKEGGKVIHWMKNKKRGREGEKEELRHCARGTKS